MVKVAKWNLGVSELLAPTVLKLSFGRGLVVAATNWELSPFAVATRWRQLLFRCLLLPHRGYCYLSRTRFDPALTGKILKNTSMFTTAELNNRYLIVFLTIPYKSAFALFIVCPLSSMLSQCVGLWQPRFLFPAAVATVSLMLSCTNFSVKFCLALSLVNFVWECGSF